MGERKPPKRGRPKVERGAQIFWRNGRAYGDFRAYADVGGTKSSLAESGKTWGTNDPALADALFAAELTRLQEKRRTGAGAQQGRNTTLDVLVRDHLIKKRKANKTSLSHLNDLDQRLRVAIEFFGTKRDPRTIEPDDVRRWAEDLAKDGKRKPGTVRHFLNALSGLYGRAQEGLYVEKKYNPVSELQEKPTGWSGRSEATSFEVHEAALILEAARIVEKRNRMNATPGLHTLIGMFLLTSGRASEVLGLDVDDVSFDRGRVYFRPNEHRGLKTRTSRRDVPLWPQARELLQQWMFGGADGPRTSGLLFPSNTGGVIRDIRRGTCQRQWDTLRD